MRISKKAGISLRLLRRPKVFGNFGFMSGLVTVCEGGMLNFSATW
jgi:hypothetical protein